MNRLQKKYNTEVIPKMQEAFGYKNVNMVPKLEKVVINVGLSKGLGNAKFTEAVEKTLTRITGQKPVFTKAKKAVSAFKIRDGMIVGAKVTLRASKMYDFLDKLVNVTFPRVRDFRGISPDGMDGRGNYSIGFKENVAFPEVNPQEIEHLHGLEVAVSTSAKTDKEGLELLKLLGFPFKKNAEPTRK